MKDYLKNVDLYKIYPKAQALLESWDSYLSAVDEAMGKPMSLDKKIVLATCLENTQQQIAKVEAMFETTQPSDIGPFKKFGLELVTAVVPNLIATDIVSVQPLGNKVGEIWYIKYLYGTNKGQVKAGDEYNSTLNFTGGNFNYSSEIVEDEAIDEAGQTTYSGSLSFIPVRPGTVKINVNNTILTDDGNGVISGTGLTSGTINYETGQYSLTFSAPTTTDLTASYEYNLETVPTTVPQVDIKIASLPIMARSRKLRALYAFDAAFDLQKDYGTEINTSLISQIAGEIKHEIDGEIQEDLRNIAYSTIPAFSTTAPQGVSLQDHYDSFYNKIIEAGNKIFKETRRASVNFVIGGVGVANVVEANRRFVRSGAVNPVGPHLAGHLNGIPFYKNPFYPDNEYVAGYKGDGLFDSGYVYAPYMPVMTTSLIMMDDFVGRRGFATSYGKKVVNNKLYAKGTITA